MSAFFLFDNLEVIDPDGLTAYVEGVAPVVAKYGGVYRVLGGSKETLEGDLTLTYPVLIEFEDRERAIDWYRSEDYRVLKELRTRSVRCECILLDGLPNPREPGGAVI